MTSLELETITGDVVVKDDIKHDLSNKHVTYIPQERGGIEELLYWSLPSIYCGDKV